MAPGTFDYGTDAERKSIERAIAFASEMHALALAAPAIGGLYNISSGRRLTLQEQAEAIIRVFSPPGHPSALVGRAEKANLIESYFYDVGKAARSFGWFPKYSFDDMLIDYQKEMKSGRFDYLVEKRRMQMQGLASL